MTMVQVHVHSSCYIEADTYDSETEGHGPCLDVLMYGDSKWQSHTVGEENHIT